MYIDTHCHLDDDKFSDTDTIIKEYLKQNVDTVINNGCDLKSSYNGKLLSCKYSSVYFAVGVHPENVENFDDFSIDVYKEFLALTKDPKCVAVGEVGLDYHYQPFDKNKQKSMFESQIDLAIKSNLPFIVHSRDATEDTFNIINDRKQNLVNGFILHCFSGSVETAEKYLNLGGYLGFGGTVTFKNANKILDVVRYCPLDRMLTETDSPYLSPSPKRGTLNMPSNIPIIAEFLSGIKLKKVDEFASVIKKNAYTVFKKLQ